MGSLGICGREHEEGLVRGLGSVLEGVRDGSKNQGLF